MAGQNRRVKAAATNKRKHGKDFYSALGVREQKPEAGGLLLTLSFARELVVAEG